MAEQVLVGPRKTAPERRFRITVVDGDGTTSQLRVTGVSRSRVRMELKSDGRDVTEVQEVTPWWSRAGTVPDRVLLDTTRQLAAFSEAGISILDALGMIAASTKHRSMRRALNAMIGDIRDGETLPQAAQAHPLVFPDYYIAMLEASERTGNLPGTFDTLASYLERDTASKRAVKSALAYPTILVVLGTIAVAVLSTVVLPRFVEFFDDLDVELPLATRLLMQVTAFLASWWLVTIGSVVGVSLLLVAYGRTAGGGRRLDRILLRLPVFGPLLRDIALERLCRVLGNLAGAGVPLVDALRLAAAAVGNRNYRYAIDRTREGVLRGEGLAAPMANTGTFPTEVVQVLRVGEQTGRLTEQLEHAARFYAREVDYRLKTLTALIEPFALLVVGAAVGFVAVALVSAMYGIYSATSVGG